MLLFCGCGQTKTYKIGVSQCSDDDWRHKMNEEIFREIMFYPNVTVEIRSADDSSEKQIEDIKYFIENNFDIIIAAPNEAEALTPIISEAYDDGIPVLLFDRNIIGENYTAWQGADNLGIGKAAAEYVKNIVGKSAPVVEIYGLKGSTPADERHEGFIGVPGVNVVATGYGKWNYDDAYRVADSLLTLYPDTRVVYAHNDRMAIAAADVASKLGLSPYVIGIDAAPQIGLKAVADSVITATFIYPTEGQQLVRTAMAILEGDEFEKIKRLPALPAVDASNIDIILTQNEAIRNETARMEDLKAQVDEYWERHSSQTAVFYAVLVIVILLFAVLFQILRSFWQHRKYQASLIRQNKLLQEERDKQKFLNEQLDAATSSKLMFFTNVSHDLRTPLTLISEPVEQLVNSPNITTHERSLMKIAQKNVFILKRLINQILDLRKLEHHKLELHLKETDFAALVAEWSDAFSSLALRTNMDFTVDIRNEGAPTMAIDVEKMERVFYNIVANAFKYTPDGGTIKIEYIGTDAEAVIRVKDSGQGISAEDLPLVFDRFFQSNHVHPNGSGIGLALAKSFVELHGGTIEVESRSGEGSEFTVKLPVSHVDEKYESVPESFISTENVDMELGKFNPTAEPSKIDRDLEQPTILVIDDNPDILALLKDLLADSFLVVTANNGREGLGLAEKYVPDLIICDMMMPEMDGLECVRRVKENPITSHIPVIMLTACAMDEQRVEGYGAGADGYLSKPFSSTVLLARCRNLIEGRRRIYKTLESRGFIQAYPEKETPVSEQPAGDVSPLTNLSNIDSEFYQKFLETVRRDMSNPDLNIEMIASEMGIAYGQLYRKIKALTNYRPVELLRLLRLETARELLINSEKTISEISYDVGFSTPAYFTKCYRDHFGEPPSDTRAR